MPLYAGLQRILKVVATDLDRTEAIDGFTSADGPSQGFEDERNRRQPLLAIYDKQRR